MSNPGTIPSPGGRLAAIILFLPAARLLFHLINNPDMNPNAALAIGLPAAGVFFVALLIPSPRSVTGRLLKGMTILVLVIMGLFSLSGFLILSISPLLFSASLIIGLALDTHHRLSAQAVTGRTQKTHPALAAVPDRPEAP